MEFDRQLADLLGEFARTLSTNFLIQSILDHLVDRIVGVLPITAAGITLLSPDTTAEHISASGTAALHLAQLQTEVGEGPGLAAYKTGHIVVVPDLRTDDRFPSFASRAVGDALMAVFAFPLRQGDSQLGALELYRDVAGPLDAGAMMAAQTLADVAAAYLINARPAPTAARSHLEGARQPSRS
jgi:GAF domain-containing protein